MKQILQSLRNGRTEVAAVPSPAVGKGELLITSSRTLISLGTERMLIDFGKASLLSKVRQQPDKVRVVLDKIKTDGLVRTIESVLSKLDQPLPMGYCNVGRVTALGEGVFGFEIGDRVASNGRHAEIVSVPVNLCAKVPDDVDDDSAAFTVIAAVALQGVRLLQPTLGETVVVTGLGLVGLLTVQLLRAHGCRVLGLDFAADKLALAQEFGATVMDPSKDDPVAAARRLSRGRGVDGVIVTASTSSSEPMHQAASMCRKRGRIVLVGTAGLELSRADFYEKELTFQVSCSYGPGRYDPAYEQEGYDYPIGFVRWTEQRNFEAVLDMLAEQRLRVDRLITHRFSIDDAERAYRLLDGAEPSLGILLEYPGVEVGRAERTVRLAEPDSSGGRAAGASVGFIGAGNYAASALIPAFKAAGAQLRTVASMGGVSGGHAGKKFGFEQATTDIDSVIADDKIDALVITTRHDSHAALVCAGLRAGKHVYVEKPLALNAAELAAVAAAYEASLTHARRPVLTVGFNRRYAPHVEKMAALLATTSEPKAFVATINAGAVPRQHWTQDPSVGGGRIIGEACHFIDLLRFLAGASIERHSIIGMRTPTADTATISLRFADGSIGSIHYLSNGSRSFPKERLEVFVEGRVLKLDNFRKLTGFGWPRFNSMSSWRQDKGQNACARAFLQGVANGKPPIPFDQLIEVARVTIAVREALQS
jgi:predicted dehydrogenase/threonine dehydrogenase-like Zn-dependent dehydrogenase